MGGYNHCLKVNATIMVSNKCPMIGTHIVIIFMTHITIASDNSLKHP